MLPERSVICPVLVGREPSLDTARAVLDGARDGATLPGTGTVRRIAVR